MRLLALGRRQHETKSARFWPRVELTLTPKPVKIEVLKDLGAILGHKGRQEGGAMIQVEKADLGAAFWDGFGTKLEPGIDLWFHKLHEDEARSFQYTGQSCM